ncbi:hypothetical protein HRI_002361800 [Hibiscus trionum]|uniref:Reverse transcriptase/retrotransposon-derived protein RNase H-like domain-containing protein n=1 Tax=Hibiscus trionum TaxID=183268 RepID=A0A9W7HYR6_HIBTR|nr:hypothetical protein HRI_002361800 [Hibiscus trionum]
MVLSPIYSRLCSFGISFIRLVMQGDTSEWTISSQEAFDLIKQKLSSTPVLGMPDFTKEFVVETNTSGVGIGAVLTQGN